LLPLPNNDSMTIKDELAKANFFKNLYKKVKARIEKKDGKVSL